MKLMNSSPVYTGEHTGGHALSDLPDHRALWIPVCLCSPSAFLLPSPYPPFPLFGFICYLLRFAHYICVIAIRMFDQSSQESTRATHSSPGNK